MTTLLLYRGGRFRVGRAGKAANRTLAAAVGLSSAAASEWMFTRCKNLQVGLFQVCVGTDQSRTEKRVRHCYRTVHCASAIYCPLQKRPRRPYGEDRCSEGEFPTTTRYVGGGQRECLVNTWNPPWCGRGHVYGKTQHISLPP